MLWFSANDPLKVHITRLKKEIRITLQEQILGFSWLRYISYPSMLSFMLGFWGLRSPCRLQFL